MTVAWQGKGAAEASVWRCLAASARGGGVLHFILITCQNSLLPSARLTKRQSELELETEMETEMELERGWAMINAARQRGSR